jgi:hypothetical protein
VSDGATQLADAVARLPLDQSLLVLIDGDGTLAYHTISFADLRVPERAHLTLDLLLARRSDIRMEKGQD